MNNKCKICRRLGVKLFLKGERCYSPKCSLVKRPYPPGLKGKRRKAKLSEYGKGLREKQKLRNWYGLEEKQLKRYVKEVLFHGKKGGKDLSQLLLQKLELRLDNVIRKLGFASSISQARQMVSHKFFLVNEKPLNISSAILKVGDEIKIKPKFFEKEIVKIIRQNLKNYETPTWLKLNKEKLEAKIIRLPNKEEISVPVEMRAIFEFYAK